jgi:hypothetical protein
MTNDTIDQEARVTQAAIARLPRHAAVGTDLDAARMRIMRTLYLGAHSRVAESRGIRHEMTADKPSRPLGAASTTAGPGGVRAVLSVLVTDSPAHRAALGMEMT